jgi:hypothetical protein
MHSEDGQRLAARTTAGDRRQSAYDADDAHDDLPCVPVAVSSSSHPKPAFRVNDCSVLCTTLPSWVVSARPRMVCSKPAGTRHQLARVSQFFLLPPSRQDSAMTERHNQTHFVRSCRSSIRRACHHTRAYTENHRDTHHPSINPRAPVPHNGRQHPLRCRPFSFSFKRESSALLRSARR